MNTARPDYEKIRAMVEGRARSPACSRAQAERLPDRDADPSTPSTPTPTPSTPSGDDLGPADGRVRVS